MKIFFQFSFLFGNQLITCVIFLKVINDSLTLFSFLIIGLFIVALCSRGGHIKVFHALLLGFLSFAGTHGIFISYRVFEKVRFFGDTFLIFRCLLGMLLLFGIELFKLAAQRVRICRCVRRILLLRFRILFRSFFSADILGHFLV